MAVGGQQVTEDPFPTFNSKTGIKASGYPFLGFYPLGLPIPVSPPRETYCGGFK